MGNSPNNMMNTFIRGKSKPAPVTNNSPDDLQKLLERAIVYIEKTGCSIYEAFEVVGIRKPPGETTDGKPSKVVDMNAWIRKQAGK